MALCEHVFNLDECELDEYFSLPLRRQLEEPADQMSFANMLKQTGQFGCAANMYVENLLNDIKAATPFSRICPTFEHIAYAGGLAQLMKDFLEQGFKDCRKEHRSDLFRSGVPIRPTKRSG